MKYGKRKKAQTKTTNTKNKKHKYKNDASRCRHQLLCRTSSRFLLQATHLLQTIRLPLRVTRYIFIIIIIIIIIVIIKISIISIIVITYIAS